MVGTSPVSVRYSPVLGVNLEKPSQSEPNLVQSLIRLTDSPYSKVQCRSVLALRNLAADDGSKSPKYR